MRQSTHFALAALIVLCSISIAHAIPQLINYQGILLDGGGTPITVVTNVEFRIWDMSAAGAELWMETQSVTPDSDGRFNVLLGSVNPIPDLALASADAYLGMTITPDAEMTPRTQLVSVAYAYRPGTVDGATGGTISGDVAIQSDLTVSGKATIGPGHTNTGANAFVAGASNTASEGGATVGGGYTNTASGAVSTVGGGQFNNASGIYATVGGGNLNTASGLWSVVAGGSENTASGNYSFAAGQRAKANHAGTFVWADGSSADFSSTATHQFQIRARNGLYQKANNDSYGAWFVNDGNGDGIRTHTNVSKGNTWAALWAFNIGTSPAIYGFSSAGLAAYLVGNVHITGTLTKGAGAFKIDHPLDPENKYLVHSFVESPDMMNVYNGNVMTDADGMVRVELPDYFNALNRDYRYQLTVIGQFAQAIVSEKVVGNWFAIRTDKPHVEVSWQVTGIRQDAYANANRIVVEEQKPVAERGLYLHPEAHGKLASLGINNHAKQKDSQ